MDFNIYEDPYEGIVYVFLRIEAPGLLLLTNFF